MKTADCCSAGDDWKSLKWKDSASTCWEGWGHVMPFLSLDELYTLSHTGEMFRMIVDVFFATGTVVVEDAFLRNHPSRDNIGFYKHVGRSAESLTITDTMNEDLRPLLSCFPNLKELKLRRVRIPHNEIKGYPTKLRKLQMNQCHINRPFLEKWSAALSRTLGTLYLFGVGEKLAETIGGASNLQVLDIPSTTAITTDTTTGRRTRKRLNVMGDSAPSTVKKLKVSVENGSPSTLEDFSFDVPSSDATLKEFERAYKTLTILKMTSCPQEEIGVLSRLKLKHLTILKPIEDTEQWSAVVRLRSGLETFKCSFTASEIDVLPDESLVKIINYLGTEDCIALTHVNSRFRRIVLDHVYPTKEIELKDYRYPLSKCVQIYETMTQRVRKVKIAQESYLNDRIFSLLDFPNLKSLKMNCRLDRVQKIPAGLEILHLRQCPADKLELLLAQIAPTIQDLALKSDTFPSTVPLMPNLRKLGANVCWTTLEIILRQNPNLEELRVVTPYKTEDGNLNSLLRALKCTPRLTKLSIDLARLERKKEDPVADQVLPMLQELTIPFSYSYVDDKYSFEYVGSYFLGHFSGSEIRKLSIPYFLKEIMIFKAHLEFLSIDTRLKITKIMSVLKNFPNLVDLRTADNISFAETMHLTTYLASTGRQLTFNGAKFAFKSLIN